MTHEGLPTPAMMVNVSGFEVRQDLAYEMDTHMWVDVRSPRSVRVGMDPLGLETSGTLAQLQFAVPGSTVTRRADMGSLEAEKFVGPLISPLSGVVLAINHDAVANPSTVERDPFGAGWMIEIEPSNLADELSELTVGHDDILSKFAARVAQYRRDGVLAE